MILAPKYKKIGDPCYRFYLNFKFAKLENCCVLNLNVGFWKFWPVFAMFSFQSLLYRDVWADGSENLVPKNESFYSKGQWYREELQGFR